MDAPSSILLVEGDADRLFFEHLLKKLGINAAVRVSVPKQLGESHNSKGGVMNSLPTLLEQMRDGRVVRFSAVVDSDFPENGGGQAKTLAVFESKIRTFGFLERRRVGESGGYLFSHNDGLRPIGLWVMPDNNNDGMIEDLVGDTVVASEKARFSDSVTAVEKSNRPFLFKPAHRVKADIATWLAWQKIPGQGIFACVRDDLIDLQTGPLEKLTAWLRCSFA